MSEIASLYRDSQAIFKYWLEDKQWKRYIFRIYSKPQKER
jgi:hypothetical protein